MIFRWHGQALHRWVQRGTLGNSPREQNTAPFQPKIVMEMACLVLLDHVKKRPGRFACLAASLRFRSNFKASLPLILLQAHGNSKTSAFLHGSLSARS